MAKTVKLFYSKNYSVIEPVDRIINARNNIIQETIELLLDGKLTDEERENGFLTEFPHPDFKLLNYNLNNGVLTLTFPEVFGFTSGGSSRVILLASQIEKTALQFNEVKEVVLKPETLFQP